LNPNNACFSQFVKHLPFRFISSKNVKNCKMRSSTAVKVLAAIILSETVNGFAFVSKIVSPMTKSDTALSMSIGLYYSTSTGNTETCAGYIAEAAGGLEIEDIGDASDGEVTGHDALIVGAPTWHTGDDEQRSGTSWDDWLYDTLPNLDLEGKKVAVFGCGDQQSYSDYYCDAAGELYDLFSAKGCKVYGLTSTDNYDHVSSKAERDGKFVGCMFDEDNQYDLSEERAKNWVSQLKEEGFM